MQLASRFLGNVSEVRAEASLEWTESWRGGKGLDCLFVGAVVWLAAGHLDEVQDKVAFSQMTSGSILQLLFDYSKTLGNDTHV